MMESKIAHLQLIQNVITRMASNSFLLKGWAVTLVSAIFALASKDTNQSFIFISLIPIISFWILDGYFLQQERLFRKLYESSLNSNSQRDTDFSLDTSQFRPTVDWSIHNIKNQFLVHRKLMWIGCTFSLTLIVFYGLLTLLLFIVSLMMLNT